jgi:hypothetical protein
MTRLRNSLLAMGVDATCYNFNQVGAAGKWLQEAREAHQLAMGYGYSLGNTPLTWLQTQMKLDLVFCIALSELAGRNNQPINKHNTGRACLVRGPGFLSDALVSGFDEVRYCPKPHLLIDLDDGVKLWALQEARRLMDARDIIGAPS